jgi:hypothetical protein
LGYWDGFEAEFKLNDKEASVDYDKAGHKLAIKLKSKKVNCQGADIFQLPILIKSKKRLKLQMIKGNYV